MQLLKSVFLASIHTKSISVTWSKQIRNIAPCCVGYKFCYHCRYQFALKRGTNKAIPSPVQRQMARNSKWHCYSHVVVQCFKLKSPCSTGWINSSRERNLLSMQTDGEKQQMALLHNQVVFQCMLQTEKLAACDIPQVNISSERVVTNLLSNKVKVQ